jgi:hypothetical protein
MIGDEDYTDLKQHRLPDGWAPEHRVVPDKVRRRRRRYFISVPMLWFERLEGASGQTHRVALSLLHQHFKSKGPVRVSNSLLKIDGVSRQSKWRALRELERRGLITIECRPRRSPTITLLDLD